MRTTLSQLVIIISLLAIVVFEQHPQLDFSYWGWWGFARILFLGIYGALILIYIVILTVRFSTSNDVCSGYIAISSIMFVLWLWLPVLCFLFMAITVWHFRNDWQVYDRSAYSVCFIFVCARYLRFLKLKNICNGCT